jgi:predicted O-methyltransferase YrrM
VHSPPHRAPSAALLAESETANKTMIESDYIQPPPLLQQITERTSALGFNMASEPKTGALLRVLAAAKPKGRLLELGTGTGIATAWLLAGMDADSTLISVDTNPEVQQVARESLGSDPRLQLVLEDALAFLRRQPAESFDLIFADAMPGKYEGLDESLRAVRPGGFYVIDDMLPQPNWPPGHAEKVAPLLRQLASHKFLAIVPLAWASGVVVAVKRCSEA